MVYLNLSWKVLETVISTFSSFTREKLNIFIYFLFQQLCEVLDITYMWKCGKWGWQWLGKFSKATELPNGLRKGIASWKMKSTFSTVEHTLHRRTWKFVLEIFGEGEKCFHKWDSSLCRMDVDGKWSTPGLPFMEQNACGGTDHSVAPGALGWEWVLRKLASVFVPCLKLTVMTSMGDAWFYSIILFSVSKIRKLD